MRMTYTEFYNKIDQSVKHIVHNTSQEGVIKTSSDTISIHNVTVVLDIPYYSMNNLELINLITLDLSGLQIISEDSNYWRSPYIYCPNITSLNVTGLYPRSEITSITGIFIDLRNIETIDISSWNFSNISNFDGFYNNISSSVLKTINFGTQDLSNIQSISDWFSGLTQLRNINITVTQKPINCTNFNYTFSNCNSLTSIDISIFTNPNVQTEYVTNMLSGCTSLKTLDISGLYFPNTVEDFSIPNSITSVMAKNCTFTSPVSNIFTNLSNIGTLNLAGSKTNGITSYANMFKGCSKVTSINIEGFDGSRISNYTSMFEGCSALTLITCSKKTFKTTGTYTNMFKNCNSLTGVRVVYPKYSSDNKYKLTKIIKNGNNGTISFIDTNGIETESLSISLPNNIKVNGTVDELIFSTPDILTDNIIERFLETRKPISSKDDVIDPESESIVFWAKDPSLLVTNLIFPNGIITSSESLENEKNKIVLLPNWKSDSLPSRFELDITFKKRNNIENPNLVIQNADGQEIGTFILCDSTGNALGTDSWSAGDEVTVKCAGQKARLFIGGSGGGSATIPTKLSQLENDEGFITADDIPAIPSKTSELENDSGFITSTTIPTKTSDLVNDSNFVTSDSVPTKTSELENDSNFINQIKTVNGQSLLGEGDVSIQPDYNVSQWAIENYVISYN